MAALAASIPVSSVLAKRNECEKIWFISTYAQEGSDVKYQYGVWLCPTGITSFATAADEEKKVTLETTKTVGENNGLAYNADYKIISVKQEEYDTDAYDVVAELQVVNDNEYEPVPNLDFKMFKFTYYSDHVVLTDKNGGEYFEIWNEEDFYEDCYLTTACVGVLGKPDDCIELTAMRKLRDDILGRMDGGRAMIDDYYAMAPGIIKSINRQPDKKAIYMDIYNQMIVPVMKNMDSKNFSEAVNTYRNYTYFLKSRFLV